MLRRLRTLIAAGCFAGLAGLFVPGAASTARAEGAGAGPGLLLRAGQWQFDFQGSAPADRRSERRCVTQEDAQELVQALQTHPQTGGGSCAAPSGPLAGAATGPWTIERTCPDGRRQRAVLTRIEAQTLSGHLETLEGAKPVRRLEFKGHWLDARCAARPGKTP